MGTPKRSESELHEEIRQLRSELASVHQNKEEQTAELFNSEERFAEAMRVASDGLWDWDLDTDEVYYSPRWKSMLGYDDAELPNDLSTWAKTVHADDKEFVLNAAKDYLSGKRDAFEVEMRMRHKDGYHLFIRSRAFKVRKDCGSQSYRLIGTHVDITQRKRDELFAERNAKILEMIAKGNPASEIYDEIAHLYEERHPGMRCSMLELEGDTLLHGGAPSMPKAYCDAVHGLKNGPEIGSCGASTYTGKRVIVENIETDPKWENLKQVAMPFGMRCCWSEPIKSASGKVLGAFGMYYDHPASPNEDESLDLTSAARLASVIMERDHNLKRIRDLAFKDDLTGLSSRAHLFQYIDKFIQNTSQENHRFSLLYIDLDNFKSVNDSLGHDIGDLLLKEIASRLKVIKGEIDFIARLGGDEFCVLIKDTNDSSHIVSVAQRCLDVISKPTDFFGRKFIPTCSIGIACYPDDGTDLQALLKAADTALYAAKDLGKYCYAFYQKDLSDKADYRFKVEQYLREAIENFQLTLVYQPQVDINSGVITGVEALSRWHHPQLGQVSPIDFIGTAERIGMIKPLTEWVLKTACNQAVSWKRSGLPVVRMAVNISPSHFLDSDLIPLIQKVLKESGMVASELELEVTESVVQTSQQNLSVFRGLKELGVLLAIDDFGTGYSSFASLKHLNVDYLKIDKYFIDDMLNDRKSELLVGSMIEMGHNLGHEIIAEGIETPEQLGMLEKMCCETAQGYLFSRPVSADAIAELLEKEKITEYDIA
ncbi:bifunctional diguanylate cyclase/phosphodiesterase [Amphritea balenae]|uniref:EAL domain-containing protein n=1 Tax=Amphritea balenae TaxID=452629 RepID=A0A3P1SZC1_9GAMM|nr:EAL domain-containing protein [Amphritea balenae]RRD01473.1 EAL domain-containing protein [Amphritea balenae]GGK56816.1 bifunctional diguanylate cyclase/phosphodiesterase [Amphritea balenae]